jgi:hypothetical protein
LSLAVTTGATIELTLDADQLQALIVNAVQEGMEALSAKEGLKNQAQALQHISSGRQVPRISFGFQFSP